MEAIDEKVKAVDLLDECWFFDNLLRRGTTMVRCHSDPCTSSNFNQFDESTSSSSRSKRPGDGVVGSNKLIRLPSLPPCIGRKEEDNVQEKERNSGKTNLAAAKPCVANKEGFAGQSSLRNLLRTPSLPPDFGRSEDLYQDKDSDVRMSKLIRQAFAKSSGFLQHQHSSKVNTEISFLN